MSGLIIDSAIGGGRPHAVGPRDPLGGIRRNLSPFDLDSRPATREQRAPKRYEILRLVHWDGVPADAGAGRLLAELRSAGRLREVAVRSFPALPSATSSQWLTALLARLRRFLRPPLEFSGRPSLPAHRSGRSAGRDSLATRVFRGRSQIERMRAQWTELGPSSGNSGAIVQFGRCAP